MQTINIHEAKTHLSRLVDRAANGKPFVIAKSGKPRESDRVGSAGGRAGKASWFSYGPDLRA